MIIIGEKVNGTLTKVKKAIEERDSKFIKELAKAQDNAGADYIDVNAGTEPSREVDDLKWLIENVQEVTNKPICIDSSVPESIKEVIPFIKNKGIINSVSLEKNKVDIVYPIAKEYGFDVIMLPIDNTGIPKTTNQRIENIDKLVKLANDNGIETSRLYVDPLVIALSTENNSAIKFIEIIKTTKSKYPDIKIVSGLSNISFGMPLRKIVNRSFMTLAMHEGMDAAIMNPLDKEMMATILATNALMSNDKYCRKFSTSFRKGKI